VKTHKPVLKSHVVFFCGWPVESGHAGLGLDCTGHGLVSEEEPDCGGSCGRNVQGNYEGLSTRLPLVLMAS